MNVTILDEARTPIAIIDDYLSLIWTERYSEYGDFELYMHIGDTLPSYIRPNYYVCIDESSRIMIIEEIKIETNFESGNILTVSGRSVESILERRVVDSVLGAKQVKSVTVAINSLFYYYIDNPSDQDRKIEEFSLGSSENVPQITKPFDIIFQRGSSVYAIIKDLCDLHHVGFRADLNLLNKCFWFHLYGGKDRSYNQNENSVVVFSEEYDNLTATSYTFSQKSYFNTAYVAGEGEGAGRTVAIVPDDIIDSETGTSIKAMGKAAKGLSRREIFIDARDLQSEDADGVSKYLEMLQERGVEKLAENKKDETVSAELSSATQFTYGTDFFLGDIVQIINCYGITRKARVSEYVRSVSQDRGVEEYPVFTLEEESEEK